MGRKTLYICLSHVIISIGQTEYWSTPDGGRLDGSHIKAWEVLLKTSGISHAFSICRKIAY